jgi:hypothetical protein
MVSTRDELLRKTTVRRGALGAAMCGVVVLGAASSPAAENQFDRAALEHHIQFLASDELSGRGNGTAGLQKAAQYIAAQFAQLELMPVGDEGTYFQSFQVMLAREIGGRTELTVRTPDGVSRLDHLDDFEPMTFSASGELAAPVVFVGYGVTAPELGYDDYRGVDVEGKAVLLLRYVPGQALGRGSFEKDGWHATFVRKVQNAASRGASAVILVNGPLQHREDRLIPFGTDLGAESVTIPALHLKRATAERLMHAVGADLTSVQRSIDENVAPRSFELNRVVVNLSVDVRRTSVEVANVIGFLPSTAPASTNDSPEHIVIGAHYDHLGLGEYGSRERQANGKIHNGADDNASGVAGMLELARVFSVSEDRPRGILFAAFAGEEMGLLGSRHYTESSEHLRKVVSMINLDMIGRLRHKRLYIGGAELVPSLLETLERYVGAEGLTLSTRFSAESSSDHASFIRSGVPALFFFTGLHGDYHKPTDDPQFVNLDGVEQVLRVSYNVSNYLLRSSTRPVLNTMAGDDGGLVSRRAAKRAYFGVGIDNSFDGDGVRFSYIAAGGPAAAAGLQAGDVLLELDGRAVVSGARAGSLIQQRRPGETVNAKILRKDRVLEVRIQLTQWP